MDSTTLGRTGLKVSRIGFGGIPIQRLTTDVAVRVVRYALKMGCSLIDTARVYTDSEKKIGAALAGLSDKPVVVSKTYSREAAAALQDIGISRENLGIDCIDVYLAHNVGSVEELTDVLGPDGALEGLRRARRRGWINHIGISSHKVRVLDAALDHEIFSVVEAPFNAVEDQFLPVLQKARNRNVGTIIMKPLAGGALENATSALKFILERRVGCVVPGMQSRAEVQENTTISGRLSPSERSTLMSQVETLDERFCRRCEYCLPACPQDINITKILLFGSYSSRYGLVEWAQERYQDMDVPADSCVSCGRCEERCPYELPVQDMLQDAHDSLAS